MSRVRVTAGALLKNQSLTTRKSLAGKNATGITLPLKNENLQGTSPSCANRNPVAVTIPLAGAAVPAFHGLRRDCRRGASSWLAGAPPPSRARASWVCTKKPPVPFRDWRLCFHHPMVAGELGIRLPLRMNGRGGPRQAEGGCRRQRKRMSIFLLTTAVELVATRRPAQSFQAWPKVFSHPIGSRAISERCP